MAEDYNRGRKSPLKKGKTTPFEEQFYMDDPGDSNMGASAPRIKKAGMAAESAVKPMPVEKDREPLDHQDLERESLSHYENRHGG